VRVTSPTRLRSTKRSLTVWYWSSTVLPDSSSLKARSAPSAPKLMFRKPVVWANRSPVGKTRWCSKGLSGAAGSVRAITTPSAVSTSPRSASKSRNRSRVFEHTASSVSGVRSDGGTS
jgi:hypothetical protein